MAQIRQFPGVIGPGKMLRSFESFNEDTPSIVSLTPNASSIKGGTAVTITGTNFIPGAEGNTSAIVAFGGSLATNIVIVDRQTITCVAPAYITSGAVDVTVTIRSKTATVYGAFFYYETVITAVSPSHGPLAGGTTVLITGYNFLLGSTITFGGVAATNIIWLDAEHIRCTTPAHAVGFVDIVVTEP